ncbi:winged helix-turn-helix domain-containing protein [Parabacteroides sp.]
MDKKVVGVNAGVVWHALNEVKEISISELARKLNMSVESTALAIGWLARENKVCLQNRDGAIEVFDEHHFPFCFG